MNDSFKGKRRARVAAEARVGRGREARVATVRRATTADGAAAENENAAAARRGAVPGAGNVVVVTKLHCTLAVFWLGF